MSTTNPTDLFLVNRSDVSYYVTQANLMAQIKDTDLMLINRDDVSYKITGVDVKKSLVDPIELTVTLAPTLPVVGTVETATAIVGGGKEPDSGYVFSYQWSTATDATGTGKVNINGATNSTYTPVQSDSDKYLGCTVTTADAFGTAASTTTYAGPVDPGEKEPDITSVVLTEADGTDNDRFTSSLFPYTVDMSEEGKPDPTYALKAKLTGVTFNFGVKSSTITGVADTVIPGGWTGVSIPTATWRGVTYGANTFVAVSSSGTAIYSADGITWLNSSMPSGTGQEKYYSVAYGNGKFVAVSSSADPNNAVISSTNNGQTWSAGSSSTGGSIPDQSWNSVVYGGDKFVAVSANGSYRIMYSTSGTSWTTIASPLNVTYRSIAYGGGKFVAITDGSSDQVTYSSNGINWDILSVSGVSNLSSITYGDGKFVAVGNGGSGARAMSSTDGINWTALTVPAQAWNSVTYGDGKFLAVGNNNDTDVMYSTDLTNWTLGSASEHNSWNSVVYGGDKFVAISRDGTNRAMWSLTGVNEVKATALTCASNSNLDKLNTEGGAVFMTDGDIASDGTYAIASYQPTSSDITAATVTELNGDWNLSTAAFEASWRSVAYGNNTYVAVSSYVSSSNRAMYSPDGINWSTSGGTDEKNWNSVAFGNGIFVAVANSGTGRVMYSQNNGESWTSGSGAPDSSWYSVTYGDGKFVAVGYNASTTTVSNNVMYSSNGGQSWVGTDSAAARSYNGVTYGNGKFVAVGGGNGLDQVMYSTDAINWTAATSVESNPWQAVTYGNGKFVAVSLTGTNQVMYSIDGINWTAAAASEANSWRSVAYGNGRFIATAYSGDNRVMYSTDAISWTAGESIPSYEWYGVCYGGNKFVAVANNSDQTMSSISGTGLSGTQADLTFADPCTDLQYFNVGDTVTAEEGNALYAAQTPAFSTTLYAGSNTGLEINSGIDNTEKSLVWIKTRNRGASHCLFDTERGVSKILNSNNSAIQGQDNNSLQQFSSNGFILGTYSLVNDTGYNFVAWNFRAAPGFMDIVEYTGTGIAGQTIPHSLASYPGMMVVRVLDGSDDWCIYHTALGADYRIKLNSAEIPELSTQYWNGTQPSNTTFTVGTDSEVNSNGLKYIAYLFASDDTNIKCGQYSGDNSGVFVSCGFQPGWVMVKNITNNGDWTIFDSTRGGSVYLRPNLSNAEATDSPAFQFAPNGFTFPTNLTNSDFNLSGDDFIFIAIRDGATASTFIPTGIVAEEPNTTNRTLKLNNITGNWADSTGFNTTIPASGAGGTWDSYTGSVATVSDTTGRWIGANAGSKAFSIAPVDGITEQTAEVYCAMQIIDDKAEVMGIQSTDPGFLNVTAKDYTIEFPALFTSGEAPDTALPAGTAITATVKAENTVGASVRESNTFIPQLVAPEGSAGPITGSTETVLTVGSSANLSGFVANDSLVMVDDTGAVASYTPTTTAITGVTDVPGGWTGVESAENTQWRAVQYGLNKFVAVASSGTNRGMYSTDGTSWEPSPSIPEAAYYDMAFNDTSGIFMAVGNNQISTSNDAMSWSNSSKEGGSWNTIGFGNNKFIALSDGGLSSSGPTQLTSSNNGSSWVPATFSDDLKKTRWNSILYANNVWVALGADGTNNFMHSTDGETWTYNDVTGIATNDYTSLAFGDGKFLAGNGNNKVVAYSTNGINWTEVATEFRTRGLTYGEGKFLAVTIEPGAYSATSLDGITWKLGTQLTQKMDSVAYGGNRFVAVTTDKNITNPQTAWSLTGEDGYSELTFTDNQDLAFLKSGDLLTSSAVTAVGPTFSTTLYTGNQQENRSITTGIDNTNKALIWVKDRDAGNNHRLYDTVRGVTLVLSSNTTNGNVTESNGITSFTSDGYVTGSSSGTNDNGSNIVAWNFRAAPGFLDIQTWSGNDVGREIPHNLASTPAFIITKSTTANTDWYCYHKDLNVPESSFVSLNLTEQAQGTTRALWNNTLPTSNTFSVGPGGNNTNNSGQEYIAYLFADTPGTIKCGQFPSSEITTVDLGFEPGWLMVKHVNQNGAWYMFDATRGLASSTGGNSSRLSANTSGEEFNQTGLWIESGSPTVLRTDMNFSTADCIYIAIAENATATGILKHRHTNS